MSKLITLSNLSRFKTQADLAYAAKSAVDTLIGADTGKSARTIAAEELASQLIPANAQEALNTLSEIAAWIQEHPEDAAAINEAIAALQDKVDTGDLPVSEYVSQLVTLAIGALNIGDYAKTADLGDLAAKDTVAEADLDTALKEKVNAAAQGNHSHSNKTVLDGITSAKVSSWDAKSDFSGAYADLTGKPTIPEAYTHPASHPASMITGLATVATSGNYNDLENKPTIPSTVASLSDAGNYALKTEIPNITEATEAEIDALFA